MRISYRLIMVLVGAVLLLGGRADAQSWWGRKPAPRKRQSVARRPQRRPAGQQPGFDDEKLVMGRVRGYQAQLGREEQMLSKRLAEAERLRQRGLQQKDQRLLDQAERYERKALATYQQRVQMFERQRFSSPKASPTPARQPQASSGTRRSSAPRGRSRSASPRRRTSRR